MSMGAREAAAKVAARVEAAVARRGAQAAARLAVRAEVRAGEEVSAGATRRHQRRALAMSRAALHDHAPGLRIARAVAVYLQIAWKQRQTLRAELPLYNIRGM